jgi:hypothetical protein
MKNIWKDIKKFMMHPTLHSLVLALTAIYLMFGVMNAGFILVQVLYSIGSFFVENNHITIF